MPLLKPQSLLNVCRFGLTSHRLKQSKWVSWLLEPGSTALTQILRSSFEPPRVTEMSPLETLYLSFFQTANHIIVIVPEAATLP